MKKVLQLGCTLTVMLFAFAAVPAHARAEAFGWHAHQRIGAQRGQGVRAQARRQRRIERQENRPAVRRALGLPPKWMEKLRAMSPEEQERFFRNNARFQNLPPERQAQVRQNLQRWNAMTPQQREALRNREQIFSRLTPDEQKEVVKDLAPRWKKLPQQRRELLLGRMRVLRGMTPEQREQALNDPQFMRGLDSNEQDLLRKLSSLRLEPEHPPDSEQ